MSTAQILVYSTAYCPFCDRAKALLRSKGVPFEDVRVDDRPDVRAAIAKASGQRTVPQIFINGQSIGGFMELAALERAGTLDELIAEPHALSDPPSPR